MNRRKQGRVENEVGFRHVLVMGLIVLGFLSSSCVGQEFNVEGISLDCRLALSEASQLELTLSTADSSLIAVVDRDVCTWEFSDGRFVLRCDSRSLSRDEQALVLRIRARRTGNRTWLLGAALGFLGGSIVAGIVTSGYGQEPAFGPISLAGSFVGGVIGSRLGRKSTDWLECYERMENANAN